MMTSSSSLNTVLKTTVTLSFLDSTYLKASAAGGGCCYQRVEQYQAGFLKNAGSHGLVIAVVDHGPLLALFALLLELEVLLKDRGEAVPLQHARLVDHLVLVGRQSVQVVEEGDIVSWWRGR